MMVASLGGVNKVWANACSLQTVKLDSQIGGVI